MYLNPVGLLGGAERSLLDLMASLREARPEIELTLLAATDGTLVERAKDLGAAVDVVPMPDQWARLGDSGLSSPGAVGGAFLRSLPAVASLCGYVKRMARIVRELRPDIVHSNGIKTHLLTKWVVPKAVPVVWHVRDYLSSRRLVPKVMKWGGGEPARVLAISDSVARDVRSVLPDLDTRVVYNAIDTDTFSPTDGPADMAGSKIRVGLIGTFARWKGQDLFLKAAAKVAASVTGKDVEFVIVGGPVYRTGGSQFSDEELATLASGLGLKEQVTFVPFCKDIADWFRRLDIVVHASTRPEPFGRTIVEAMACGKPTIVSAAGGAAELFTEGHDALGFPPGDADALAGAMRRLLSDKDLRQRLGHNARQTAVSRFDRRGLGPRVVEVYGQLLGGVSAPAPKSAAGSIRGC